MQISARQAKAFAQLISVQDIALCIQRFPEEYREFLRLIDGEGGTCNVVNPIVEGGEKETNFTPV